MDRLRIRDGDLAPNALELRLRLGRGRRAQRLGGSGRLVGTVPASGLLEITTAFPDLGPGVESATLFTQPLFLGTGGALTLGAPYTVTVLDSAF